MSIRLVLLALTVVLSMFPVVLAGIPSENEYLFAKVVLVLGDLPALALAVAAAPLVAGAIRARRLIPMLWAALVAVEALALVAHPSAEGVQTILRLVTALAIIATVAAIRVDLERRFMIGVIAAVAITQSVIGVLQVLYGAPIGLAMLGETTDPLVTAGNVGAIVAPEGTVLHPHILASLAVLASTAIVSELIRSGPPLPWAVAAALALVPAGMTFSRAALGGVALAIAALARGTVLRRARYAFAVAALLIGFGVPALAGLSGWTTRAEVGLDVSRRDELVSQSMVLIAEHPLTGVGPGRQLIALRELHDRAPGRVTYLNAVHDVPLTVAIESGVVGLTVVAVLLAVVGYRALRAGGPALALFLGYLPFVLLDHFPYTHQHGLVLTAVWLGFLALATEPAPA